MNVNEKGYIGVLEVTRDLHKRGYEVFLPLHDYSASDMVVLNESGIPKRLQVKYRALKDNTIDIPMFTVMNNKKIKIDRSRIDGWAIYVPEVEKVVYVPVENSNHVGNSLTVRFNLPRTLNQHRSWLFVNDYLEPKNFWER
jgi:hypothetical protein